MIAVNTDQNTHPFLDMDKIRRFEKSFERSNQSHSLAKFWNEIAKEFDFYNNYVDELEGTITALQIRHSRFVETVTQNIKLIKMGKRALKQVRVFDFHLKILENASEAA